MNSPDCIRWKKRRTVAWLNLSLAARGAVEGIVVALDARGELRLGKPGLPGLAALLGRPWAECEPAVAELLEAEKFVFDAVRGVLFDPQHVERQDLGVVVDNIPEPDIRPDVADVSDMSGHVRSRPRRPPSMTPDAVRKRARRRELLAMQLELPSLADVRTSVSPLSDLNSSTKTARDRTPSIKLSVSDVPPACNELACRLRPELPTEVLARSWKRFALRKSGRFNSWAMIEAEWETWILSEKAPGTTADASAPPKSEQRVTRAAEAPPRPILVPPLELRDVLAYPAAAIARHEAPGPPASAAVA